MPMYHCKDINDSTLYINTMQKMYVLKIKSHSYTSQKLTRRKDSLEKTDLREKTKEEVWKVLTPEYTSSDESEYEDNPDTNESELVRYNLKQLPWQRSKLKLIKKHLDNVYYKSMPRRTKAMLVPRHREGLVSSRAIPENAFAWAARKTNSPTTCSSINTSNGSFSPLSSTPLPPQKKQV